MPLLTIVKAPTLCTEPGSFVIGEGSADSINCYWYDGVIHRGRGVREVVVKGVASLSVYGGDRAFYALKLSIDHQIIRYT